MAEISRYIIADCIFIPSTVASSNRKGKLSVGAYVTHGDDRLTFHSTRVKSNEQQNPNKINSTLADELKYFLTRAFSVLLTITN